eukprot:CAMPEP_0168397088 /NCGR_PEP_ID=MMETSP0228-20121227/20883_1 /TAXON_ID=133427 /ORGANISM="Protoceratium reticulatum, Strain CCCM 535 (=CCMP 1889)" /LENGTH=76 /DNA_ID=CAMNT_0008410549 /DNA_START=1 /DNA_END=228 /DNA_ORIENTATION=-
MAAPRSLVLTATTLLLGTALLGYAGSTFVAAPHRAPAPPQAAAPALPTAALAAATLTAPTAAHAGEGSFWIPALSA